MKKRVALTLQHRARLLQKYDKNKYLRYLNSNVNISATIVLNTLKAPEYLDQVRKFINKHTYYENF